MRAPVSPQLRFLLRAAPLLFVMLALWWWLLLPPMLAAMRMSTDLVLRVLPGEGSTNGVKLDPKGNWILRVPVPASVAQREVVQQAFGRAPGSPAVKIRSFQLVAPKEIPTFFTLTFPLYWALILAGPRTPRLWRVAAIGSGLLAVLAQLSMFLYTAYTIGNNLQLLSTDSAIPLWGAAEYMNINVAPYMAPFLIALWLHAGLRAQIFSWDEPAAAMPVPVVDKPRRARRRR